MYDDYYESRTYGTCAKCGKQSSIMESFRDGNYRNKWLCDECDEEVRNKPKE